MGTPTRFNETLPGTKQGKSSTEAGPGIIRLGDQIQNQTFSILRTPEVNRGFVGPYDFTKSPNIGKWRNQIYTP